MTRDDRLSLARRSLDGLSVGDALGETFFGSEERARDRINRRAVPPAPWRFTDDTAMAISILEILARHGRIDQNALAKAFADRYVHSPARGYGRGAHIILGDVAQGFSWRDVSRGAFGGQGSMGNGGAMRVAPLGAWFSDDPDRAAEEARKSAEVTHAHPEGREGAAAVAVAAAWAAARGRGEAGRSKIFDWVLPRLNRGAVWEGVRRAAGLELSLAPAVAASILGSGDRVLAEDTVPFTLWCASRHADSFSDAFWCTVAGFGDRDTTCAIVGGIVALSDMRVGVPDQWKARREKLWEIRP
jgi:ADP-ribosylglycohydrolase